MKTGFNRFVSAFISLSILLTLSLPALAINTKSSSAINQASIVLKNMCNLSEVQIIDATSGIDEPKITSNKVAVVYDEAGKSVIVLAEEFDDGNAAVSVIEGNSIVSATYINRNKGTTEYIDYEDQSSFTLRTPTNDSDAIALAAISYEYLGRIRYTYNGSNANICGANIYFSSEGPKNDRYNLNGTYKNITGFIAAMSAFLTIPVTILNPFAGKVLTAIGIAATAVNFVVPNLYVDCTKTVNHWKVTDNSNNSNTSTFVGSRYIYSCAGVTDSHADEELFYEKSAFTGRNRAFAFFVFPILFNYYTFDLYDWYIA